MFGLLIFEGNTWNKLRFSADLHRRERMFFIFLLIIANVTTVISLPGVDTETHLDCTNDYHEHMFCEFKAQNCSEYNVSLSTKNCIPKQCGSQCCCSFETILVSGETHTVEVRRGNQRVQSKIFDVTQSIKPKVPTIISVDEVNGNFQVKWKNNMQGFFESSLTAEVMYRKKGDTENVTKSFKPQTMDNLNIYEISGEDLKPSTTYVVTVRTYTNRSGKFSDSSNEVEFSTPASHYALLLGLILGLSIAAVLIATAAFYCFVKVRRTWDNCPNPKLPILRPYAEELLKPQAPITSSVSVEPLIPDDSKSWSKGSLTDSCSGNLQQSSGIGSGSSCLSYANTEEHDIMASRLDALSKALPGISPVSPLTSNLLNKSNQAGGLFSAPCTPCGVKAVEVNSGSSDFDNKSYSILIPNLPHQDGSEVQTQAEMVCDSAYHPVEGNMETCPDQGAPACPLLNFSLSGSPLMATEMSYQQCNADSGRLSYEEDSSLFSISSDTDTTASCDPAPRVEAGYESVDEGASRTTEPNQERKVATISDDNTSYVPAGSQSCPQVDDAYQPFQTLVGQPVRE
ncbi:uncharacterized protein LOC117758025 [Hippoglossus hippoglossus]|uniref:uncharacterized protein LOC117758025 n=1 Tax=Hippoglossus hippoglossus TaxID=8267 RepID=UPI00148C6776|nr:uncharacterized protein LOC117758025 [Hippoglossus hippoglossus]